MNPRSEVIVAGKSGCSLCEAAKKKLVLLGEPYRFLDLMNPPDNWRDLGAREAMMEYAYLDIPDRNGAFGKLPWLRVDGEWLDYPTATSRLRQRARKRETQAVPELCGAAGC